MQNQMAAARKASKAAAKERRKAGRGGAGGTAITLHTYNLLVAAFRDLGPNFSAAGRRVGIDDSTAKRGWLSGWARHGFPPIMIEVERERQDIRARVKDLEAQILAQKDVEARREAEEKYARARGQFIDARAEEAMMVSTVRRNVIDLGDVVSTTIETAIHIGKRVHDMVHNEECKFTPMEGVNMINKLAASIGTIASAAKDAQQLERALLGTGEPIKPGDALAKTGEPVDVDALIDEADKFKALLQRGRARGKLLVVSNSRALPQEADVDTIPNDVLEAEGEEVEDEQVEVEE